VIKNIIYIQSLNDVVIFFVLLLYEGELRVLGRNFWCVDPFKIFDVGSKGKSIFISKVSSIVFKETIKLANQGIFIFYSDSVQHSNSSPIMILGHIHECNTTTHMLLCFHLLVVTSV